MYRIVIVLKTDEMTRAADLGAGNSRPIDLAYDAMRVRATSMVGTVRWRI